MSLLSRLADGLDRRLGWRDAARRGQADLAKPLPPRVGWAWTLGSSALALTLVQLVSGAALSLHYQPTPDAARQSVAAIRDKVPMGWLLHSLHHWGAHFIVAFLLAHAAKVFVTGGHKGKRDLTWIVGSAILFTMLALAFTGHLLPWSDLSYWGTVVGIEQVRATPVAGGLAADAIQGGSDVGAATLTRFYVLHILFLPAALLALVALHLWLVRRHGVSPAESVIDEEAKGLAALSEGGRPYVPHHALKEGAAAVLLVGTLVTLAALWPADIGRPAGDRTPPGLRPEWYFLAVYQYLKFWPSRLLGVPGETIGICLLMAASAAFVFLPFIDRSPERAPSRRKLALAAGACAALAWLALTLMGAAADRDVAAFGKTWRFNAWGLPR